MKTLMSNWVKRRAAQRRLRRMSRDLHVYMNFGELLCYCSLSYSLTTLVSSVFYCLFVCSILGHRSALAVHFDHLPFGCTKDFSGLRARVESSVTGILTRSAKNVFII